MVAQLFALSDFVILTVTAYESLAWLAEKIALHLPRVDWRDYTAQQFTRGVTALRDP